MLVIDDEEDLADALAQALRASDMIVEVAHDGAAARAKLAEAPFDALVMDFRLAEEDGVALLQRFYRDGRRIPAVLYSAYLDVATTVRALKAGFHDVLEKPVSVQTLRRRLRSLLQVGRPPALPDDLPAADELVGDSPQMIELRANIQRVGSYRHMSVLIIGETGTGKELIARGIHTASGVDGPFLAVNCAAIPETLFEDELFGHEAGAYTGARAARAGLLEQAEHGTLFLDEVGEMPASLQAKLLRVLETQRYRRVGGQSERGFSARIVSATNRDIDDSALRADLFHRLAGYVVRPVPLREHRSDVPALVQHFLQRFAARVGEAEPQLSWAAIRLLEAYEFPGNVRELRAIVEHAAVVSGGTKIGEELLQRLLETRAPHARGPGPAFGGPVAPLAAVPSVPGSSPSAAHSLPELERELSIRAYEASGHNLSQAARQLGIPRTTLRGRLKRYGVL